MSFFYKVPYIARRKKCFHCNNGLSEKKTAEIMVYDYITADGKVECFEFDYCPICDLIQMSRETYKIITGQHLQIRMISNTNLDLYKLKEQMLKEYVAHKHNKKPKKRKYDGLSQEDRQKQWIKRIKEKYDLHITTPKKMFLNKFQVVPNEIWSYDSNVYSFIAQEYSFLNFCSVCARRLSLSYVLVPINSSECVRLNGKVCQKCNYIYVEHCIELQKLFIDNIYARNISFNGKCYAYYSKEMQARAKSERISFYKSKYKSVIYIFSLKGEKDSVEYIIVEKVEDEKVDENVLHYRHPIAREIIAAMLIEEKQKKAIVEKNNYIVSCIMEQEKIQYIPPYITLIDDDKYERCIKSEVLLYSPITRKYELIKIYIGDYNDCYLGVSAFRQFVRYYGKPHVDIYIGESSQKSFGKTRYSELRAESILKLFGYSANEKDKLSSKVRQSILCDIVDLELVTVKQVISLLRFFIDTHTNDRYFYARAKWQEDLNYMTNYRANPDRFLIFKSN